MGDFLDIYLILQVKITRSAKFDIYIYTDFVTRSSRPLEVGRDCGAIVGDGDMGACVE